MTLSAMQFTPPSSPSPPSENCLSEGSALNSYRRGLLEASFYRCMDACTEMAVTEASSEVCHIECANEISREKTYLLVQDGISMLQNLEVLEVVGARALRIEGGMGRLPNLESLELNSCE